MLRQCYCKDVPVLLTLKFDLVDTCVHEDRAGIVFGIRAYPLVLSCLSRARFMSLRNLLDRDMSSYRDCKCIFVL